MEELEAEGRGVELAKGCSIISIAYHERLNVILVGTEDGRFFVVDPTLRDIVYTTTTRKSIYQVPVFKKNIVQ